MTPHPEAEALLNAIYDHPDDDTPRLVYADWLQEHGQDDYAHFIRLSIRAENPALPLAERKPLVSERKHYWKRMVAMRHDAIRHTPINLFQFQRGTCDVVYADGDTFVRTSESWWPVVAPRELVVHGARGFGAPGTEARLVREIAARLPWLRALSLQSRPTRNAHELSELGYPALSGALFAEFAAPGAFPQLVSLTVSVVEFDRDALVALVASPVVERWHAMRLVFRTDQAPGFRLATKHLREGGARAELRDLIEQLA